MNYQPIQAADFLQGIARASLGVQPIHSFTRESTGCGLDATRTSVCSCGFRTRTVYESDDSMSTNLKAMERDHLNAVSMTRPLLHLARPPEAPARSWPFMSPILDEPEDDDEPNETGYCECNAEPTVSELERLMCAACGKALS